MWCRLRWLWWWWRWRCQQGPWPIVIARLLRSALVRQGRLCFRNPPHHRIRCIRLQDPGSLSPGGFLPFDVCVCVHITVFVYLCIYVFLYFLLPMRSLHSFLCWIHVLCNISVFVVFVPRLLFLLCIYVFGIFFDDHWSSLISIFMDLILFSVIRSHSNRGCTIRTGPSSYPTKM